MDVALQREFRDASDGVCGEMKKQDRPQTKTILGLDIGGTKSAVVEGTAGGCILQRFEMPTEAERPCIETLPRLLAMCAEAGDIAIRAGRCPAAISVSVGGPLNIAEGVLIDPPHLPGWHGVRLKDVIAESFPALPVFVEHDGNAGALAEFRFGVGPARPGLQHLVFLTFGTGLGAGLIVNGKIVHGATDTAGEVGHLRLSMEGPKGFGKQGSWEGWASGAGLAGLASARFPERWPAGTPIREVVSAMLADDPDALAVAAEVGEWMGRGMALVVDTLNPQAIVLGSLAVALGDRILASARRTLAEEALPQAVEACEILPAMLGARLGDVAALIAALDDPATLAKLM